MGAVVETQLALELEVADVCGDDQFYGEYVQTDWALGSQEPVQFQSRYGGSIC